MRVATSTMYDSAILDIQAAQRDLVEAQRQTGSEKVADDLKGYGADTKSLLSARGFLARTESYQKSNTETAARLSTQDLVLGQASDAVSDLRTDLADAVASGRGEGLMRAVEDAFATVSSAMNTTYAGRYVFGGVREDTPPVNATSLDTLPAVGAMDTIFDNADRPLQSRVDANTTLDTAPLAQDISQEVFEIMKRIYDYDQANGLDGQLSNADSDFLRTEMGNLSDAFETLNQAEADNGAVQAQLEQTNERLDDQALYFEQLAGDIENADLAQVSNDLNRAQLRIDASAAVFNAIRDTSLLNRL